MIRPYLTPTISLASKAEVAKALGKSDKEIGSLKSWKDLVKTKK